MNILILQGPNLNLLGLKSSREDFKLTLNKLNRQIKNHFLNSDVNFKIYQTHKHFQAINYLQRNRNWADGVLLIPTSWARNDYTLLETLNLIELPVAVVYFDNQFSFGTSKNDSILASKNISDFCGSPIDSCIKAIKHLIG